VTAQRPLPGDEVVVAVDRLAYGGEGVARLGDYVVFVDRAAPGDRVRARVRRTRRRHAEAEAVAVEAPGPGRVTPRCQHYTEGCGGCAWQHLDYEAQLVAKEAIVRDSLERLGGFRGLPIQPIARAASPWYFRNKMGFAFHPQGGLGLHLRGAWDRIFELQTCFLQSPLSVAIVHEARAFARERGLSLYDPRARQGLLRELAVRHSEATGEVMIGLVTAPGPFPEAHEMAARLAALDPRIATVVRAVQAGSNDGSPLERVEALRGSGRITEVVRGLRFAIGLETFFQTNSAQAGTLVDLVRALAGPLAGATVVDVFCGVGLFTLALAADAAHVAGVEIVEAAVIAARENAAANGVANVSFDAGDARLTLPAVLARHPAPAVVVLDPPRGGAGGKVMRRIARAGPGRIVYVSCNPTTLARDLRELVPFGYRITAVHPVDLFPQTYHVEAVVALERGADPTVGSTSAD